MLRGRVGRDFKSHSKPMGVARIISFTELACAEFNVCMCFACMKIRPHPLVNTQDAFTELFKHCGARLAETTRVHIDVIQAANH